MNTETEERVRVLEEEIAHLAKANDELSSELAAQWKQIDGLAKKLKLLESRFAAIQENLGPAPENTKPPHW